MRPWRPSIRFARRQRPVNRLCVQRNGALQHLLFATHYSYVMLRIDQGRNNSPPERGTKGPSS
ncbi:MAG: hypothetical protein EOQ27_26725 [Mesorhizobium sp.]|nr:hypothetical protein EOA31_21095 [Mesorhizobium sp. M4B.F.Ca.ET.049.02.1.2]RVD20115.1 hypothetical protein EN738_24000 [Mesorhizobium sp. M4B.F.Ca.ET.017.02.2.1]RWA59088.1 MAG: hypothetical protein EOQ27_26725 [Mesorhizobium sp.]TGV25219.1 hypothetical protein EN786_17505 [Mesorhizobium sp. M4B.F.Ca.ET.143.01.1.1]